MWLYWSLLSTIISGFTSIALKKCSNNDSKQIAIAGLLLYHLLMIIVSLIAYPKFLTQLNIIDFVKMLPGILLQSLLDVSSSIFNRFSLLDGNVSITSVINSSSIVITLIAARFILKEKLSWQKYIMIFGITICVFILAIL